jgi:hypothetical protein
LDRFYFFNEPVPSTEIGVLGLNLVGPVSGGPFSGLRIREIYDSFRKVRREVVIVYSSLDCHFFGVDSLIIRDLWTLSIKPQCKQTFNYEKPIEILSGEALRIPRVLEEDLNFLRDGEIKVLYYGRNLDSQSDFI